MIRLKRIFIGALSSMLGWTLVNKYVVEVSLGHYLIIEMIVLGLYFFYILATREIKHSTADDTKTQKSQGDSFPQM